MIELIGAITLLVVGAYAVFMLLMVAIQSDAEGAHYSIARAQAQQLMESWRVNPLTSLQAVPSTPLSQLPGGSYNVSVVPQNGAGKTALYLATVSVSWQEPAHGADHYYLDTYLCGGGVSRKGRDSSEEDAEIESWKRVKGDRDKDDVDAEKSDVDSAVGDLDKDDVDKAREDLDRVEVDVDRVKADLDKDDGDDIDKDDADVDKARKADVEAARQDLDKVKKDVDKAGKDLDKRDAAAAKSDLDEVKVDLDTIRADVERVDVDCDKASPGKGRLDQENDDDTEE